MIRFYFFTLLLFFFIQDGKTQTCGNPGPTNLQKKQYLDFLQKMRFEKTQKSTSTSDFVSVPLTVRIVRDDDGLGGVEIDKWERAFERLNGVYKDAKVRFFICGQVEYINDSELNDYHFIDDWFTYDPYYVPNTLNIIIVKSLSGACGYSYTASSSFNNIAVVDEDCMETSVLEHEIGHSLGLLHTHEGDELVARPEDGKPFNCDVEGDAFCDTPADPYPVGQYLINPNTCVKEVRDGFAAPKDANGEEYKPDQTNIMSYSLEKCRSKFSQEQIDFIHFAARNNAGYVLMNCPDAPKANFEVDELVAVVGEPVQLFNRSTGNNISSYNWTFTNANSSSSDVEDPKITFNETGNHNVTLEVTNSGGTDQITLPVKVLNLTELPFVEGFESGLSLLSSHYGVYEAAETAVTINSVAGKTGNGLSMMGTGDQDFFFATAMEDNISFAINPRFLSRFVIPAVDARDFINLQLTFDAKLLFNDHHSNTSMRVLINGEPISSSYTISSNGEEVWNNYQFDLSAYDGEVFDLTIEVVAKELGNGAYIDNFNIDGLSTVGQTELRSSWKVYPNPSKGVFNVKTEANTLIKVRDVQGKVVCQKTSFNGLEILDLSTKEPGVYFITLSSNKMMKVVQVVKK